MFSERVCYDFSTTAINAVKFNVLIHLVADNHSVLSHIHIEHFDGKPERARIGQGRKMPYDVLICISHNSNLHLFVSFVHYSLLL